MIVTCVRVQNCAFGRPHTKLGVASLFQRKNQPSVSQHWSLLQPLKQTFPGLYRHLAYIHTCTVGTDVMWASVREQCLYNLYIVTCWSISGWTLRSSQLMTRKAVLSSKKYMTKWRQWLAIINIWRALCSWEHVPYILENILRIETS